jgi:hypothetical protein
VAKRLRKRMRWLNIRMVDMANTHASVKRRSKALSNVEGAYKMPGSMRG